MNHISKRVKIGTWNVCLGFANKKDHVAGILQKNNVDICCLQETEIPQGFPENLLSCNLYDLELEQNESKKRVGILIKRGTKYTRKLTLEKLNCHIVIIDIEGVNVMRIINVYRSFRPPGGVTAESFFNTQLAVIKNAMTNNCVVMGDFNLDAKMELRPDYNYRNMLESLMCTMQNNQFFQIVTFNTWTRTIKGIKKVSSRPCLCNRCCKSNKCQLQSTDFR